MDVIVDEAIKSSTWRRSIYSIIQHSPVKVMVIPTNEEVMIARDVVAIAVPQVVNA